MNNNAASGGNPPTNALTIGTGAGSAFVDTSNAPSSTTSTDAAGNPVGTGTGITNAGIATQGTRLVMNFTNVPSGTSIAVPTVVYLTNVVNSNTITGVAVLVTGTASMRPPRLTLNPLQLAFA